MAEILGHFRGFREPHNSLNGRNKVISFDLKDLLRSAVRVGKRNTHDLMKNRFYAKMEMRYKISIILANAQLNTAGKLSKSGVYEFLDPSEKSNTSYYIGLSICHMIAEHFLGLKWIMHLDVYHGGYSIRYSSNGRSRPDLFGMNGLGEWYVLEAKGRSNKMESGLLNKAKAQTKKIKSINSKTPVKIASVSHFIDDKVILNWNDPLEDDLDAVSIIYDLNEFFEKYYMFIIAAIGGIFDDYEPDTFGEYYIARLDESGMSIGILKKNI